MTLTLPCTWAHLYLKVMTLKNGFWKKKKVADLTYFKYIQYIIGTFIFSSTYNSTSEAFDLSVNHSGILEFIITQKLNQHDPKTCLKYNLRAKS